MKNKNYEELLKEVQKLEQKIESGLTAIDIKGTNISNKVEFIYKFFKPEVERKGLKFIFKNGLPAKDAVIMTNNEKVYGILTNLQ